jgi:hypothetical protein
MGPSRRCNGRSDVSVSYSRAFNDETSSSTSLLLYTTVQYPTTPTHVVDRVLPDGCLREGRLCWRQWLDPTWHNHHWLAVFDECYGAIQVGNAVHAPVYQNSGRLTPAMILIGGRTHQSAPPIRSVEKHQLDQLDPGQNPRVSRCSQEAFLSSREFRETTVWMG